MSLSNLVAWVCETFEEDGYRDPAKAMKAESVGKYWKAQRHAED